MKNYQKIILAVISSLLLFLSFMDLGFLAWFALIPFFSVIYNSSFKQSLLFSFICGLGYFMGVTYWTVELPVKFAWVLIFILMSLYFMIFGIAVYFIFKKIPQAYLRIFLVPAVWILMEFIRSQTYMAFTTGILGYSQHYFLPLMQITRFTGIYGVSFIILLFNITVFETIWFSLKNKKFTSRYLIISAAILTVSIAYGMISVGNNLDRVIAGKGYNEVKIAAVQPNIIFGQKYEEGGGDLIPEPYSRDSYFKEGTDLVVFSESVLWGFMDRNKVFADWAEKTLRKQNMYLLVGQYTYNKDKSEYYNSAVLYDPGFKIIGKYDEIHPVPFSQFMPYPKITGFFKFLDFSIVNLVPGNDHTPLHLPDKGKLGINICYESTLSSVSRNFRKSGAEAIIVIADNSSMSDSIAPWNHLIFSKVRAIENGVYVVHCTNTGISGIISPDGNILTKTKLLTKDVMYGSIYLIPEKTFYAKFGNLLLFLYLGAVSAGTFIFLLSRKIRKRRAK